MSAFYNRLFELIKEKHIIQNGLIKNCNISKATIAKMKANQYVSIEVLERISRYLSCDIGDIVTVNDPYEGIDVLPSLIYLQH